MASQLTENRSLHLILSQNGKHHQLQINKPEDSLTNQLKELVCNDMMKTLFPNLHTIARISLSIPVSTASVERSFSQMKLIKTQLRSCLSVKSLSNLMKIAIESPDQLTDQDLEQVIDTWQRKNRRITV